MAAAAVLFVLLFSFIALPRRGARLDPPAGWADLARRTIAGAYHVHSSRSDGAADKGEIAAAAAAAGLRFVIFTDHGDATRPPDPPAYLDGVLCLDAVEISTVDGHYVALDMPQSPYPLGGTARAVAEDVARLGGFGIAAHPDSVKPELRWMDETVDVDGLEWLNADSEWRSASRGALVRAGIGYLVRPAAALTSLLHRPDESLRRWDALTRTRPVVGLAGLDAHGGMGRRLEDGSRSNLPGVPRYRDSFRTFSTRVILDHPLSGDAASDARAVYAAIRAGRVFTTIDALGAPGLIDFHAELPSGSRVEMGSGVAEGAIATLKASALAPPGASLVMIHEGREAMLPLGSDARFAASEPIQAGEGGYRVEIRVPGAPGAPPIPWLVSNPIYVVPSLPPRAILMPDLGAPAGDVSWHIEKDPGSSAILRTRDRRVEVEFTLRPGERVSQFVAVAAPLASERPLTSISFDGTATRPMRLSVQVRFDTLPGTPRWGQSVYLDPTARAVVVRAQDLRPMQGGEASVPDTTLARALLFVVDLTNTPPGRKATFELSNIRIGR
jgi:hypothetical protein